MKIISWNVNGIRAVERKEELEKLLVDYSPDILLIQEIKAKEEQLTLLKEKYNNYKQFYHSAEKPGYAGTSVWVSVDMCNDCTFSVGMPDFDDTEGRISRLGFGEYEVLGVYFPNGGKSKEAWDGKIVFYKKFLKFVNKLRLDGKKVIWGGDVNCAHEEIDLARPKENEKSIGFLPEEREWITNVVDNNWVDVFRNKYPKKVVYSWWHVITRARLRNVGWRIDYFFIDRDCASDVRSIEYLNDHMGSDHCPVMIKLKT